MSRRLAPALALLLAPIAAAPMASAAADVHVDGRFYTVSPSYYTSTVGEFAVTFSEALPWGSRVLVKYGFGGQRDDFSHGATQHLDWQDTQTVEAKSSAPYVWTANFSQTLHERSQPWSYDELQFVFIVQLPDGLKYYEKGSDTPLGFYDAKLPEGSTIGDGDATAVFQPIPVTPVQRR